MKISIASDHGGLTLKTILIDHLTDQGFEVINRGCHSKDALDYPLYASLVCRDVQESDDTYGILCCGTGIGMSIAVNKHPGIRAAVLSDVFSARATKEHNNTNVICLGERVIGPFLAALIVDTWLGSEFQSGRHQTRLNLVREIEVRGGLING